MEAIYRKIAMPASYKTYKEIPSAIANQENFEGSI